MWGLNNHDRRGGPGRGGFRRAPFESGWGFERGERAARGGRRRLFDGEELKLLLLALVAEQPRHGYDLIREIEARSGGTYAPSPGVVYPTLTLLDDAGLIDEVKEDGARRRFALADAGRAWLDERRELADALLARLAALQADDARVDRAPVQRAMMGLHMAVRGALRQGGADAERAHRIAALVDEATQRIERL